MLTSTQLQLGDYGVFVFTVNQTIILDYDDWLLKEHREIKLKMHQNCPNSLSVRRKEMISSSSKDGGEMQMSDRHLEG